MNTPAERRARTNISGYSLCRVGRSLCSERDGGTTLNFLGRVTRFRSTSVIAHEEGDVGLSVEVDCAKWKEGRGSAESHNGVELRNLNGGAYPSRL